jgi:hypothetical protein
MSSFSRNSRKPTQALLLGISAALLGAVGHAAGDTHFTLTAYSNAAGGQEILSGDYKIALSKIDTQMHSVPDASSSNRCVALTMTAQWPAARVACDAAVRDAERAKVALASSALQQRHLQNEAIAIAYSNRAVLKWLTSDSKAAALDLQHAKALVPDSDIVAQNVAALGTRSSVAQVRSAEQL